jgi:hypothetical protein
MMHNEMAGTHDHHHPSDHHHVADLLTPDVGHDATDHDHQLTGLVAPEGGTAFRSDPGEKDLAGEHLASVIRDGPRRPPRIA